ncbi:MAG TPA: hypothetical protein VF669_11670 [Tepidisphaeraceae bacterium]|jgi:hypothetical protein
MSFCTDTDLLHWEPNILRDASFASQALISGTGTLAGTAFTLASGSFSGSHVQAGQVVVFTGTGAGCFPIVSVDSPTQITVSALYDGLEPEQGNPVATAPTGNGALTFAIRTFWAQRRIVSDLIQQAAGLKSGESAAAAIINAHELKRPCTLGTLQLIYSALAAASNNAAPLSARAELYERLYKRSLRSAKVELDMNGDGRADTVRALNVLELCRT